MMGWVFKLQKMRSWSRSSYATPLDEVMLWLWGAAKRGAAFSPITLGLQEAGIYKKSLKKNKKNKTKIGKNKAEKCMFGLGRARWQCHKRRWHKATRSVPAAASFTRVQTN